MTVDAFTMTRHAQGASAQACLLDGHLEAVPSSTASAWATANHMVELSEQFETKDCHGRMRADALLLQRW